MADKKPSSHDEFKGVAVPDDGPTPVLVPKAPQPPPTSSAASALAGAGGAAKRAIEAWAEAKGMLPQMLRGSTPDTTVVNPEYWKFPATKAFKGWSEGHLVTEEEFDTAVTEQLGASHR